MGKSQRTKGAAFEREVAHIFSAALGADFKRNIGQARDGGNDIDVGPLVVEVKRRKTLGTVYKWLQQAIAAAARRDPTGTSYPIVVAREDHGVSIVILSLDNFLDLTRDTLAQHIHLGKFGDES